LGEPLRSIKKKRNCEAVAVFLFRSRRAIRSITFAAALCASRSACRFGGSASIPLALYDASHTKKYEKKAQKPAKSLILTKCQLFIKNILFFLVINSEIVVNWTAF
jgi:hypothetical protein